MGISRAGTKRVILVTSKEPPGSRLTRFAHAAKILGVSNTVAANFGKRRRRCQVYYRRILVTRELRFVFQVRLPDHDDVQGHLTWSQLWKLEDAVTELLTLQRAVGLDANGEIGLCGG